MTEHAAGEGDGDAREKINADQRAERPIVIPN
jgi:hypothetical protein